MKGFAALALAAVSMSSADRHEGIYRFAPAPDRHCLEQVRREQAKPVKPQRLNEQPPAYAIRLKHDAEPRTTGCFRIQRER